MTAQYHRPMGPPPCVHRPGWVVFLAPEEGNAGLLRKVSSPDVRGTRSVRLANNLQILAPVSLWHDSSRPYKDLYTQNRVLSEPIHGRCGIERGPGPLDRAVADDSRAVLQGPAVFAGGRSAAQRDRPWTVRWRGSPMDRTSSGRLRS